MYADPVDPGAGKYFDIGRSGTTTGIDHVISSLISQRCSRLAGYIRRFGRPPSKVLVIGRWHSDFTNVLPGVEFAWRSISATRARS